MKASGGNSIKSGNLAKQNNGWTRMGSLYRRIPILKYIHPLLLPILILIGLMIYVLFFATAPICNCGQQIRDDRLTKIAKEGNKEVDQYLKHIDDFWNCNAKRKALLRKFNLPDEWE